MGFVTVLVQHAWAMAPSAATVQTTKTASQNPVLPPLIHASLPSLADPIRIARFVKTYNHTAVLVLDPSKAHPFLNRLDTRAHDLITHLERLARGADKSVAARARRSLVEVAKCRGVPGSVGRGSVRRVGLEGLKRCLEGPEVGGEDVEGLVEILGECCVGLHGLSGEEEVILGQCVYMILQRLEFAWTVRGFELPLDTQEALRKYVGGMEKKEFDEADGARTYHEYLRTCITDLANWFMSSKSESEEAMSKPIGLGMLSRVMRMVAIDKPRRTCAAFCEIIEDLIEKRERLLGINFVRLLATAALHDLDACHIFLAVQTVCISLCDRDPQAWTLAYESFLCAHTAISISTTSVIKSAWFESGLVVHALNSNLTKQLRTTAIECLSDLAVSGCDTEVRAMASEWRSHPRRKGCELFVRVCMGLVEGYVESLRRYEMMRRFVRSREQRGERVGTAAGAAVRAEDMKKERKEGEAVKVVGVRKERKVGRGAGGGAETREGMVEKAMVVGLAGSRMPGESYPRPDCGYHVLAVQEPMVGTAARRKLFDARRANSGM
ncbi:hypothetical protein BJ742DRAFT_884549 [Cladochytrium replicatum]|nr:hypothetical protein BJ742DRAFT_884549 [Cladochytrium replicatum]